MNLLYKTIILFLFFLPFFSCGEEDGSSIADQRSAIETYLESREIELVESNRVYQYIPNADRGGYDEATVIARGDSVSFWFETRAFSISGRAPVDKIFYSNVPYVKENLAQEGLNPQYWPEGLMKVKLGSTSLVSGINSGLVDCREGDSVVLFITSDKAYDSEIMGNIPKNTPIVYSFSIEEVKKN